ncbi:F-box/LRR-repeat protein 16-like [Aphidius gifuensis]|uniref:F-box/LRR-repeat protein 16-like n=1 Tax=Aphidius gifuensis TaxID=684658 RepID=UPI001CDD868E|nr:F-box/LRR-repeat protein 16-like [Aphidius gifuensis]
MSHYARLRRCKKLPKYKKTCWKKSKVESQILPRASNKMDNQKYYHDDAKKTTIDFVNVDCLIEIFMYLPVPERPKIALVCKKWKKALDYCWSNVNKLELTHWEYNECPSYLKKYPTIDGQFNFLSLLLDKCGRYLTELDLTAHNHCNIVPVINESCPNLVKLRLRFKYNIEHKLLVNAFSRLCKLRVLKIIFQHTNNNEYIPVNLINSLKSIAGTLTELSLSYWDKENLYQSLKIPKTFTRVIPKLKALKSIEMNGVTMDSSISILLEQFGVLVISYNNSYLNKINRCEELFKNIEHFDLYNYEVTDDCLYTIANCMNLKSLTMRCERITDAGIVAISKMNNLENIRLRGFCHVTDSSIGLLKNLKTSYLPWSNKITDVSVTKILENSPKIEVFFIVESPLVTLKFVKKAAEIATNRKTVLHLGISFTPGIKQYESRYVDLTLLYPYLELTSPFNSSNRIMYMWRNMIDN